MQNPNYNMIGGQVNILGHWVSVTTPLTDTYPCAVFAEQEGMKSMNVNASEEGS